MSFLWKQELVSELDMLKSCNESCCSSVLSLGDDDKEEPWGRVTADVIDPVILSPGSSAEIPVQVQFSNPDEVDQDDHPV